MRRNERKRLRRPSESVQGSNGFLKTNSIDIVVGAAGVSGSPFVTQNDETPPLDKDPAPPAHFAANCDINAKGVYYTTKLAQHCFAILRSSANQPDQYYRRSPVLISSLAGCLDFDGVDYTASKWAVRGLFRSARPKMEDGRYRMNLIAPWVVGRPMAKSLADV